MNETLMFLVRHGYTVLFVWVFAEQLGLPLPAVPILIAAGALAGNGQMNLLAAAGLALIAAVLSDGIWYELGRRRGVKVLQFLCRVSLEPDSCVRRTENVFTRHGAKSLLVAKFIPGFSTAAPPLAGVFQMRPARFLFWDALGSLLWSGGFIGLGYAFSSQIDVVTSKALSLGSWLFGILIAALGAYIAWKYLHRQQFLRQLRIARITPEELKQKIDAGEEVVVVDLRHSMDFEVEPETIPGAHRMEASELEEALHLIPRDRDVVLYCT